MKTTLAFLKRSLAQTAEALAKAVPRLMVTGDQEAVHDVRVALRRLRVLLRLARPVFGRAAVDAVCADYAALQQATNSLRDLEVLSETIHGLTAKDLRFKSARAAEVEVALRVQLVELCRAGAVERARERLGALLISPAKPAGQFPLSSWARKSVVAAQLRVTHQLSKGRGPKGLHRLRLTFKRLRYTVEILREALPLRLQAIAPLAARAQKALGEIHDLDVAIEQVKHSELFAGSHRSHGKAELKRTRKEKARHLRKGALDAFA